MLRKYKVGDIIKYKKGYSSEQPYIIKFVQEEYPYYGIALLSGEELATPYVDCNSLELYSELDIAYIRDKRIDEILGQ